GHNAIIRAQAFMDHCGLPVLSGEPPFGGHILSHDFVEAALMRRAGFTVWLIPEMRGSYEEMPPNLIDFAKRDQRWCQGNLQHLRLVFASGLKPVSRLHFIMGIMSYVASPLWLSFLIAGVLVAQQDKGIEPEYFPHHRVLFPDWPIFDAQTAIVLLFVSLGMLFVPKFFGLIVILRHRDTRKQVGGVIAAFASFLVETIYSVIIAPPMMLFQTTFVVSTIIGISVSWGTQNRGEESTSWLDGIRTHGWHTLFGVGMAYVTYQVAPSLIGWVAPVLIGLGLSIPMSVFSSRVSWGLFAKKLRLFLTPEESDPPPVVARVLELTHSMTAPNFPTQGLERVISDPMAHALHLAVVAQHETDGTPPPALSEEAHQKAVASGVATLTPKEKMALLWNPCALEDLFKPAVEQAVTD
ncbi:MAG: glucans biosynthesis glucosyltransferase MdoH, partial [Clostridia bacterium]|nr:glucans biosynthesis glucosyltransferase MdoH [Deltaproteobacteria bacterium]